MTKDFTFLTEQCLYHMAIHFQKIKENKKINTETFIKLFKLKEISFKRGKQLKEESKVIEKIPRLNILKQMYSQIPILYELHSDTKLILSGWKTTKEYIKNSSWK